MTLRTTLRVLLLATIALTSFACDEPTTGPDAGANGLLYFSANGRGLTYRVDLGTGTVTNLFQAGDAVPTSTGTFIARAHEGIVELDASGARVRMILEFGGGFNTHTADAVNIQLSPNGRWIAYNSANNAERNLYVIDRQSGALVVEHKLPGSGEGYYRPSWTQDNRIVAAGSTGNPGIYISDASLRTFSRIDPNLSLPTQPKVRPDGTKIAFILNNHVHVMNIDGSGHRQVTTSDYQESWPTWSPDGKWLAFYGNNSTLLLELSSNHLVDVKPISSQTREFLQSTVDSQRQFEWR